MKMKPFFTYFGGKWRTAPRYPEPIYDRLVEPFAGSAGYAVRHHSHAVELYDANEKIVGLWQYLIAASPDEIMRLPLDVTHVDDLDVCQEARWLIGFWLNKGAATPHLSPSAWMRAGSHATSFWGETIRERIATQVPHIKHWTATLSDYADVWTPDNATWFVDPPYDHESGRSYPSKVSDFDALSEWCLDLRGQVIVCERDGADWLPFKPVTWKTKSMPSSRGKGYSPEVMWTNLTSGVDEAKP
jgi:hypothetical protein